MLREQNIPVLGSKVALFSPPTKDASVALSMGFILKLPPTKNLRGMMAVEE
jgi:hypothetical protein